MSDRPLYCVKDKDILKRHLPFIQNTLKVVKNTELGHKWQKMLEIITSEKGFSREKIEQIDSSITKLKAHFIKSRIFIHKPEIIKEEAEEQPDKNGESTVLKNSSNNTAISQNANKPDTILAKDIKTNEPATSRKSNDEEENNSSTNFYWSLEHDTSEKQMEKHARKFSSSEENNVNKSCDNPEKDEMHEPQRNDNLSDKNIELRNFLSQLSNDTNSKPNELLNSFECIVGTEAFTKLKSLLVHSQISENKVLQVENHRDNRNQTDKSGSSDANRSDKLDSEEIFSLPQEVILKNVAISPTNMIIKPKPHRRTEIENLNQDVMNAFIRDEVLNANGRRKCDKVKCSEEKFDRHFNDGTEDIDHFMLQPENPSAALITKAGAIVHFKLKPCSVILRKIDLTDIKLPVNVLTNEKYVQKNMEANVNSAMIVSKTDEHSPDLNWHPEMIENIKGKETSSQDPLKLSAEMLITDYEHKEKIPVLTQIADTPSQTKKREPLIKAPISEASPSKVILLETENCVSNLSYTAVRNIILYKCSTDRCNYEEHDKEKFLYHIQSRHIFTKWSGYCNLCNKSVFNFGSLLDESAHMNEAHIQKIFKNPESPKKISNKKRQRSNDSSATEKDSDSNSAKIAKMTSRNLQSIRTTKRSKRDRCSKGDRVSSSTRILHNGQMNLPKFSNVVTASPVSDKNLLITSEAPLQDSKPISQSILRVKHLPGDKLSSMPPDMPNGLASHSIQPSGLNVTPLVLPSGLNVTLHMQHCPQNNDQNIKIVAHAPLIEIPAAANSVMRFKTLPFLRPWLEKENRKEYTIVENMIKEASLRNMFKCMANRCDYTTNDIIALEIHLRIHYRNDLNERQNILMCPFCSHSARNVSGVIHHYNTDHRFDKFCCSYCFYRSPAEVLVQAHLESYHKGKLKTVLISEIRESINLMDFLKEAKENRPKFVSPMTCATCKLRFFNLGPFFAHVKEHSGEQKHRCNKCLSEVSVQSLEHHLLNCHEILPYQCVYCRFGSKTFDGILNHCIDLHANKFPYFCERVQCGSYSYSSVESTSIRCITNISIAKPTPFSTQKKI